MKELFEAINTLFVSSPLDTILAGRMYLYEAPMDVPKPYAVFMTTSDNSDYTFDSTHHEIGMLFLITAEAGHAEEVCEVLEVLEALYDDCKLAVAGFKFLRMERTDVQLAHDPGDDWQYAVQYRILLEKE